MKEKINNKFPGRSLRSYAGWLNIRANYDDTPPLFNDQILSRVMSYLPTKDLLNCRQVCKAWTAPATEEISKQAVVYFDSEDFIDPITGMQPFISVMCNIEKPLIRRIHLFDINFRHPLVLAFFHCYGKHIWELRLEDKVENRSRSTTRTPRLPKSREPQALTPSSNKIRIQDIQNLVLFYVPHLKYLEIMNPSSSLQAESIFFDWYRTELTEILPTSGTEHPIHGMRPSSRGSLCNLQRLRVKPASKSSQKWPLIEDIIWASDQLREIHVASGVDLTTILDFLGTHGRFPNLKTLVISSFTMEELELLLIATEDQHLKLEQFHCNLSLEVCDALAKTSVFRDTFSAFLNGQKESLKVLRINEDPDAPFHLTLKTMPKLRELKMVPVDCSIPMFLSVAPIVKVVSFSGLKTDDYEMADWNYLFPSKSDGKQFTAVKNLELPNGFRQATQLSFFVKYFPNVVTLTAKRVGETTVLIGLWDAWPKLESLTLDISEDFEEITDRVFTGVSLQMYESWHYGDPPDGILSELRKHPSIANLESLRYLEITTAPKLSQFPFAMTKITGYFALMLMPQLKTLLLPSSKIDEECKKLLIERLQLERYDFDYMPGGSCWWRM